MEQQIAARFLGEQSIMSLCTASIDVRADYGTKSYDQPLPVRGEELSTHATLDFSRIFRPAISSEDLFRDRAHNLCHSQWLPHATVQSRTNVI